VRILSGRMLSRISGEKCFSTQVRRRAPDYFSKVRGIRYLQSGHSLGAKGHRRNEATGIADAPAAITERIPAYDARKRELMVRSGSFLRMGKPRTQPDLRTGFDADSPTIASKAG